MKILFRVDAGGKTGLGHFFRSLALADQLKKKNHSVYFISQPSDFWKSTVERGFKYYHFDIPPDSPKFELELIKAKGIDVFYVDGIIEYPKRYIAKIRASAKVVFYQNISKSKHLADVFILPSVHHVPDFFAKFSKSTKVYQGLQYFTFNSIVTTLPRKSPPLTIKNIAITSGGSDPANTLLQLFEMIHFKTFDEKTFIFYWGSDYQHIHKLPKKLPFNVRFEPFKHSQVLKNDLLIGAFGVSIYEFLTLGMPVFAFGHQESTARAADILAAKTGALVSLGEIAHLKECSFNQELEKLWKNKLLIKTLCESARKILDLNGVERVAEIIEKTTFNIQ